MIDPNVMRRIQKVLALSRQGVAGEKIAAEHQLQNLLKKYGLKLADFEDSVEKMKYDFAVQSAVYTQLLQQIAAMVCGRNGYRVFKIVGKSRLVRLELTASQHAEISITYSVMSKALKAEFKLAFSAFVQTNELYAAPETNGSPREKTPQEIAETRKILRRANQMKKIPVHKAITFC